MNRRQWIIVIVFVVLLHVAVVFPLMLGFYGGSVPVVERLLPVPVEPPTFRHGEVVFTDEATGETVRVREFMVSSRLAEPGSLPEGPKGGTDVSGAPPVSPLLPSPSVSLPPAGSP